MSLTRTEQRIVDALNKALDAGQKPNPHVQVDNSEVPLGPYLKEILPRDRDQITALLHRLDQPLKVADKPWIDNAAVARKTGDNLLADIAGAIRRGGMIPGRVQLDTGPVGLRSYLELLDVSRTAPAPLAAHALGTDADATMTACAAMVKGQLFSLGLLQPSTEDGADWQTRREREVKAGLESYQSTEPLPITGQAFKRRVS